MSAYAGLAVRIDLALVESDRLLDRIPRLADRAAREDDFAVIDALALNLQSLYAGLEQVFEWVAREVDGSVPGGPNWHRDLLAQMAGSVESGRQPVISSPSYACLDAVRSFRRMVRDVCAIQLDPRRVIGLAADALRWHAAVSAELRAFAQALASDD